MLIINGESYGWLHKAFFFASGAVSTIFWTTMSSLSSIKNSSYDYLKMTTMVLLVLPLIISFILFQTMKRLVGFVIVLKTSVLLMLSLLLLLFFYSEYLFQRNSHASMIICQVLYNLNLILTLLLNIYNIRFMFHFTYIEVVYYLVGYNLPFLINQSIRLFCGINPNSYCDYSSQVAYPYVTLASFGYVIIYLAYHRYVACYIDVDDDIIGTTDTIKNIVKEKIEIETIQAYIIQSKNNFFYILTLLINISINTIGIELLKLTLGKKQASYWSHAQKIWSTVITMIGMAFCSVISIQNSTWLISLTGFRLLLLAFLMVVNVGQYDWLEDIWRNMGVAAVFFASFGYLLSNTIATVIQRTDLRYKNSIAYIIALTLSLSIFTSNLLYVLSFNQLEMMTTEIRAE